MKKRYSKAAIKVEEIRDINEPVLMWVYGSGDWDGSNCYGAELVERQDWELGRSSYVLQVDAVHQATDHINHNQLFIFSLHNPLPSNVTGTCYMDGTYPIEISEDRYEFRIYTGYMQNFTDKIGSGGVEIHFANWPDNTPLINYYPYDVEVWDVKWREYT